MFEIKLYRNIEHVNFYYILISHRAVKILLSLSMCILDYPGRTVVLVTILASNYIFATYNF